MYIYLFLLLVFLLLFYLWNITLIRWKIDYFKEIENQCYF